MACTKLHFSPSLQVASVSRKSEQYRCFKPLGKSILLPVVFTMLPRVTTWRFGGSSLPSFSGGVRFLVGSVTFFKRCGQKVESEAGGCPKMFCGVPVATQSWSCSRSAFVIMFAIWISFGSIAFSTLNFRTTGAVEGTRKERQRTKVDEIGGNRQEK